MSKVYAVGVLRLDTSDNAHRIILSDRLWYLYATLEDAQTAVMENRGDLFEYYYNYALIEETLVINYEKKSDEDMTFPPREWWYKADYVRDENNQGGVIAIVTPTQKPKCLERCCYFWSG